MHIVLIYVMCINLTACRLLAVLQQDTMVREIIYTDSLFSEFLLKFSVFPKEKAAHIALETARQWLTKNSHKVAKNLLALSVMNCECKNHLFCIILPL